MSKFIINYIYYAFLQITKSLIWFIIFAPILLWNISKVWSVNCYCSLQSFTNNVRNNDLKILIFCIINTKVWTLKSRFVHVLYAFSQWNLYQNNYIYYDARVFYIRQISVTFHKQLTHFPPIFVLKTHKLY